MAMVVCIVVIEYGYGSLHCCEEAYIARPLVGVEFSYKHGYSLQVPQQSDRQVRRQGQLTERREDGGVL